MKFYTNVSHYRGSILYRGYDNGRRVQDRVKFKPSLFTLSKKDKTLWKSLDGEKIEPISFSSIGECRDFCKTYEGAVGFKIFGNTRWVSQFIQREFPENIHFDRSSVNVLNIDIEVVSDQGFPLPEDAFHPIVTICVKSSLEEVYHVWGMKPYDESLKLVNKAVEYHHFRSEDEMLKDFVRWFSTPNNTPDIITGWNSRLFDIPYVVNRVQKLLGEKVAKQLSPWGIVERKEIVIKGRGNQYYDLVGISQLDYLDLFKKFTTHTYGNQESYKLGHIAHVVLNDTKLSYEEYGNLSNLYRNNFQKFVDYNIKDVNIVDRLEDKLGLITLALTLAYIGGVNYNDTLGTTAIWDSIIYRDLARKYIAPSIDQVQSKCPDYIPEGAQAGSESGTTREASSYSGGYVKEVRPGMHKWVCSFDLNSLYPNLIIQYNMSPETLLPQWTRGVSADAILSGKNISPVMDTTMAANGAHFRSDKQGFVPRIINQIYDQRVVLKKAMLAEKKRLETISKDNRVEYYKCEREISRLENHQVAVKILLNSLYGALGNKYFRYFDFIVAEGVTTSGQLAIRWAEKAANSYLNNFLKTNNVDYVIAMDTDSLYLSLDSVVEKFSPKNPVKFLDEFCGKALEPILNKTYENLSQMMKCPTNRMGMKREAIADRGIWVAKKCYILNVHNNEGVQYNEPKIKIMGIAAVKSSTPEVCREEMRDMFRVMIQDGEEVAQRKIADFKEKFKTFSLEEIAFPRGVTDVKGYASKDLIYKKGTPIHVRASLLYNHYVKKNGLDKKYELVKNGEKIKYLHLLTPNPINENVVGFMDVLPKELGLHRFIDVDTQFQKTFLAPLDIIFKAINWKTEKVASLEDFFL